MICACFEREARFAALCRTRLPLAWQSVVTRARLETVDFQSTYLLIRNYAGKEDPDRVLRLALEEAESFEVADMFLAKLTNNLNPTRNPEKRPIDWASAGPGTAWQVIRRALSVYRQGRISQRQAWASVRKALRPFPELEAQFAATMEEINELLSPVRNTSHFSLQWQPRW